MRKITVHGALPESAMQLRHEVFVKEQGFTDSPGADDLSAHHLLMWEGELPIATCRILKTENAGEYLIGRIAVRAERRGEGLGRELLSFAEEHIRSLGGSFAVIHAQDTALGFYERCNYVPVGASDYVEGRRHTFVKKTLTKKDREEATR